MAYPVASMITRIRRILQDTPYEQLSTSDPGSSGSYVVDTFDVADGSKWATGDIAEFQDNGEQIYVQSVASNTITGLRGFNDTTPSAHSVSTRVLKNPEFPYVDILDAIRATLDSLWPYAWKVTEVTATPPSPSSAWVNLNATLIDLVSVKQLYGTNPTRLGEYGADGGRPVVFRRDLPTTLCASTVGVWFPNGIFDPTNDIFVKGRAIITNDTSGADFADISEGIDAECVAYGAASQVISDKEPQRVMQDTSQGDQSVRPITRLQAGAAYEAEYRRLLNQWYMKLMQTAAPLHQWG